MSFTPAGRLAALQAEVERLKNERSNDADETAGMLVQIAESERMRAAAQSRAAVADDRVEALEAEIEGARLRVEELEADLVRAQREASIATMRLAAAQKALANAGALLGDLERREEMASAMRARSLREALQALAGAAPAPESRIEVSGPHEVDWEVDLISQEESK